MADFLQSWEDRVPMGVVLTEAEQSAVIVMSELLGVPRSVVQDGIQYAVLAQRYKELLNGTDGQIAKLADFIQRNVPGEPSRHNEGAVECAIRLIRELLATTVELTRRLDDLTGREELDEPPL